METKKADAKRRMLAERLADHLLVYGLKGASLRSMAEAAGTSDRMLLHYFADKQRLMDATLLVVARRLLSLLELARPAPMPLRELLPHLAGLVRAPQMYPYIRVWLELAASGSGQDEPQRAVARQICESFLDWIGSALIVDREEDRVPLAALALATTEGCVLLDALGAGPVVDRALEGAALQVP